jgi:hypothetical protein
VEQRDDVAGEGLGPRRVGRAGYGPERLASTSGQDLGVLTPGERLRSAIRQEAEAVAWQPGPKGELYRNFGDGFTRAFELAVTPALFGTMGYGLDRWIGIVPVLTTIFVLVAVIGMLLRTWFGYVHRMEALEAAGPWARRP